MQNKYNNKLYLKDLRKYASVDFIDWKKLKNRTILITGATGLVGRYFIDLIMLMNKNLNLKCKIVAVSRSIKKANIFFDYFNENMFEFIEHDVVDKFEYNDNIDYIIHCASNTSPVQYATDPIGTINTNVSGTKNLLELSYEKKVKKFILISSFEVYGEVAPESKIGEHDYGKIDNTILRSCYPESKRLSESLCIAYSNQKKINTSIVRLSRVFGPTMNPESTLSISQFLKNGVNSEDIVLKSAGNQMYSFNYVGDVVTAIIKVMINGENCEAYNVSNTLFDDKLKKFAEYVAKYSDTKLIFDIPSETEKKGFSNSTWTILNSEKIEKLGWYALDNLKEKIEITLDILR